MRRILFLIYSGATHPKGIDALAFDRHGGLPPHLHGIIDALEPDCYLEGTRQFRPTFLSSYARSLRTLRDQGYIFRQDRGWKLTETGLQAAREIEQWFLDRRAEYLDWKEIYDLLEARYNYERRQKK